MKPNSKDRIKLLLIIIVFLFALSVVGYMFGYAFYPNKKTSGECTGATQIVSTENVQVIERNKKYNEWYAIKAQENDKYYLKFYKSDTGVYRECKYDITMEQYNKLIEGNTYWFSIKYSKLDDDTNGIIKQVYTDNPMK